MDLGDHTKRIRERGIPAGIPEHMHESIRSWLHKGQPHPDMMGRFFRAVLLHELMEACGSADHDNQRALMAWATWLYEAPSMSHGTRAEVMAWHLAGGLDGLDAGNPITVASTSCTCVTCPNHGRGVRR